MIGDLHCHTTLSDGSSSLEDLILYGKRSGMDFIALTDHDTLAGNTRAVMLGKRYGIGVIPGVEFSAKDSSRGGRRVHILCYLPRVPQRLEGICSKILKSRTMAGQEMIRRVMRYYPVTAEHIGRYTAGSQSIYKSHIMLALMDLGYTDRIYSELFGQLFDSKNGSCFVPTEYADVHEVLQAIHDAGGVAVMAHPFQYGGSFELLEELASRGMIDGVEKYHPRAKPQDILLAGQIAEKYGLITTGGTDFHGARTSTPNPLGTCITTENSLQALFALAGQ
ncbi:MAG: PHP domain-containing protein [Oscillospiraceae bacterium]|nr:PHP domain-containing protein [Oscillospiraceae bacterium]